jgi:hypothetical protein
LILGKKMLLVSVSLYRWERISSDEFCTVNSQLFLRDELGSMSLKHTGKTSLLVRGKNEPLGRTYADFQDFYGNEDFYRQTYIRHNLKALKATPSSLQVPLSHGGLGSSFTHGVTINQKLAKEVWVTQLLLRINKPSDAQFHALTGYCPLRVPYICSADRQVIPNDQAERVISDVKSLFLPEEKIDIDGDEKVNDLSHRQVSKMRENLKKDSYTSSLRFLPQMSELKIQDLPSLDLVKFKTYFVRKSDFQTLRYKYLGDFAKELACWVKGRPIGPTPNVQLSLSAYVEALSAKTCRSLQLKTEEAFSNKPSEDDFDDIFLTSVLDAVLNDSLENTIGDCEPVCNTEYFLSYDNAITGHINEQGSKGIPELVRPTEVTISDNPWEHDTPECTQNRVMSSHPW